MHASRDGGIEIWWAALGRCDGARLIERHIRMAGGAPVSPPRLLSLGKVAGPLLQGLVGALPGQTLPADTLMVTGSDGESAGDAGEAELLRGEHPLPGPGSLLAGQRVASWCEAARDGDRPVWVLLSGGASSLLELPAAGLTMDDLQVTHALLLDAGLPIALINTVRARLSSIKGGGLADRLGTSLARCLVLVDIPEGRPELVGSGPCSPPPTFAGSLLEALEDQGLLARLPPAVRQRLSLPDPAPAARPPTLESLASPGTLVAEAAAALEARGVKVHPDSGPRPGIDGVALADRLALHLEEGTGALLIAGEAGFALGERPGRGGRAAHLALEVLDRVAGLSRPWVFLAGASDGRDGGGEGGAVVGNGHPASASQRQEALRARSSADFHQRFGSALPAGPARTNLCDLYLAWC